MDIWSLFATWWPLLLLALLALVVYMVVRNWDTVQLFRHERHQPWYNELSDVRGLVSRKFDSHLGGVFFWEDLEKKRSAILEWPPGSKPTLIYRWVTENGIPEMMRYSDDPGVENLYIPELYVGGPLPMRARFAMRNALRELTYRLQSYTHRAH